MGILQAWFAHSIERDIARELATIESVLEAAMDAEAIIVDKADRKKRLSKILAKENNAITAGLRLKEKIERKLQPYLDGEKSTRNLAGILMLQMLLRDLENDHLWQKLQQLWTAEYRLLEMDDDAALLANLKEQAYLARLLKKIISFELNETHMHFDTSASADVHWMHLKKFWELTLKGKLLPDQNIIQRYDYHAKKGRLDPRDVQALKRIMQNYFSGKWSEVKAFTEFEKLLLMVPEDTGCFFGFDKKAWILNVIENTAREFDTRTKRQYFLDVLDSVVQHNLDHNITHIEIRFASIAFGGPEFFAEVAQTIERRHRNRISVRFIEFLTSQNPDDFFAAYQAAPRWAQKYFVAVDLPLHAARGEILGYAKRSPVPLCVHAGEFFSQKDFPQRTKIENVEAALMQVKNCVDCPNIARIGHANVLGLDITDYLKGSDSQEIGRLVRLQQKLLQDIKKRGIVIEANPTSNILIRDIAYEEHPIRIFQEHDIPFAISTDDRVNFDTNLKKEFFRVAQAMRWQERELELVARMQKEAMLK